MAFSFVARFQVRLPAGELHLIAHICDTADCVTVYNMASVFVQSDSNETLSLMNNVTNSSTNSLVQLLATRNQNTVGQVMTSVSQQLNTMNNQTIGRAMSSKYPIRIFSKYSL